MKTFATSEKRSAPAVRKVRPYVHHPIGPVQLAQRAEIRQILRGPCVQAKFTIGQPDDKYEQEADRIANEVMLMPEPRVQRTGICPECKEDGDEFVQTKPLAEQITPLVQRQIEPEEEEEEKPIQAKLADGDLLQRQVEAEEEEEEEPLQTKSKPGETPEANPSLQSRINSLKGHGQPLTPSTRGFFEPRFGHNFSGVRVHADNNASVIAKSVNAKAFTKGLELVFGSGEYAPHTTAGKNLIAHELAHVVQQGQAPGTKNNHCHVRTESSVLLRSPEFIQRRLDRVMVRYANEELWTRHPELRRRQLTRSRADARLRREWWRYYRWGEAHLSRGNCFRYVVNDPRTAGQVHSPFPGGTDPGGHITCAVIMDGARRSGASSATRDTPCARDSRKIAGVIQDASAPGWNDYHWYRQETNGRWTHKRGTGPVEFVDSSGDPITDPEAAERNYSGTPEYDRFCGYLCVPNSMDVDRIP